MKRIIGALSLFLLVLIGTIAFSPKTHAYLTENCVAIQYRNNIPSLGGTGGEEGSQVWSTDKICKKEDGTLYKGKLPKNSIQIKDYPKITISKDKKSVTVTTCKVNPTIGTSCKGKETSKPISYKKGGDFNQFARSIHGVFSSAKTQNYFELLDVDVSNAKPTNSEGDEYELGDLTHGGVDDVKEDSEMMEDCANAGGAKSLGWVICPIMSIAGEASESLYNQFVEPSLRVEPQLFTGGDSNALQGWQTFQGIANTLFVILFLIVIVSQLTGVGIDNYGIKKILPKLIVTAILINLSYFLCLLFIDISNILGNSFQALFEGLGSGLNPTMSVEQSNIEDGHPVLWTAGSLAGLGVLGTLVTMAGTIWEGPQIVLSLAIGAIGILIAIFFLFILLAARQAAIVVLVVISPVAVVCYALPNTKRLFDKWVSIFKGLLVVYPVAGLLVGGGNYVAALMLTTGSGFFISLVSMIAGIIPIFFIPTLVRSSLSALGNIGTRISDFGNRMGRRTQNYAANSRLHKGLQDRATKFSNRQRMEGNANAMRRRGAIGAISRGLRGGSTAMARDSAQYIKDVGDDANLAVLNNPEIVRQRADSARNTALKKGFQEQFSTMSKDQLLKESESAGTWLNQAGGEQRASALIEAMEQNGMDTKIHEMLAANGDMSKMTSVMQSLANSNNKVSKAYGKTGAGVDFESFMNGTGRGADGNAVTMQAYAAKKGSDFVDGLDDKALETIQRYDATSFAQGNGHIMNTNQVVQAASQLNDEDSMKQLNSMLDQRHDLNGAISGEQLTKLNDSTLKQLIRRSNNGDIGVTNAIIQASNSLMSDPKALSSIDGNTKNRINEVRRSRGLTLLP